MTASERTRVRELLRGTDPLEPGQYAQAADDAEGRRTLARILADPPRRRSSRRRWLMVTGGAVAVLSVAGAGFGALAPSSVVQGLLRGEEAHTAWGKLDTAKARVVIEAPGPAGTRAQWWFSPGEKGGGCTYMRGVTANGTSDGSTECSGPPGGLPAATEHLSISYAPLVDEWMGVSGRAAPPATQIRVRFQDGGQALVPVRQDGYFMQIFNRQRGDQPETVEATALDARGRVLKSERVEADAG